MTVEVLLVYNYAHLWCSRLIIITTQEPKLIKLNHHMLPFPNFMDLVQVELVVLGLRGFWIVLSIYCSPRATPTHPCDHLLLAYSTHFPSCLTHVHTFVVVWDELEAHT